MTDRVEFGLGKGKVFPHQKARSLLHPVRRLIQSPQALVRWIGLRGDETVLELGCGPGYFSIALRDATPRGRLVLFDLQPEMLSMAVERTGSRSGLAAVTGNAVALPFTCLVRSTSCSSPPSSGKSRPAWHPCRK
ncbi:methyltransferase domain-containing protein [Candidatus Amarobacter glycogenicus]|uniref:class I SAM-dependent methyltransferase n=1 Tax=Candidatus Amarobacter glycogenicus TaxID=3140699 RepID=UPI002A149E54|nr:methyltransferase domain-containing protein [Dehalococcoidia bacterium]